MVQNWNMKIPVQEAMKNHKLGELVWQFSSFTSNMLQPTFLLHFACKWILEGSLSVPVLKSLFTVEIRISNYNNINDNGS